MNANEETRYPYSRNRVFLSATIAALSIGLALPLLFYDTTFILYYALATFIFTVATFFAKKRLYKYIATEKETENTDDMKRARWKSLLIALLMLVGSTAGPLLLAFFISGAAWFIMITGFLTGVSLSEIVIYVQATKDDR